MMAGALACDNESDNSCYCQCAGYTQTPFFWAYMPSSYSCSFQTHKCEVLTHSDQAIESTYCKAQVLCWKPILGVFRARFLTPWIWSIDLIQLISFSHSWLVDKGKEEGGVESQRLNSLVYFLDPKA